MLIKTSMAISVLLLSLASWADCKQLLAEKNPEKLTEDQLVQYLDCVEKDEYPEKITSLLEEAIIKDDPKALETVKNIQAK
jgi:hypothetical protein